MNRRELLSAAAAVAGASLLPKHTLAQSTPPAAADAPMPRYDPLVLAEARKRSAGKKIVLFSGWATHNIGDVGHTPGTLRYLTQFFPDAHITCWILKTNDAVTGMLQRRFPNVPIVQGSVKNDGNAAEPALNAAFNECDLLIHNSGMHYNRFWNPPVGLLYACRAKNKPVGMYGQSFDGYPVGMEQKLPKLLSEASFIFTRDTQSLAFLRSQPITPAVLEFGPDGCFGVDVRDDAKADAFMAEKGLEPQKFVCVILRSDSAELLGQKNADQAAKDRAKVRQADWVAKLIDTVSHIVREHKLKVALVPEVEKEIWAAKNLIFEKLPDDVKKNVVTRDTWWNVDEAVSLYARAHSLVAMEPHSCIMALSVGTPAIHYFSQVHGIKAYMFRDIGVGEWLIDIDQEPVGTVKHTFDRIVTDPQIARAKARRAMHFVDQRSSEMAVSVADMRRNTPAPV